MRATTTAAGRRRDQAAGCPYGRKRETGQGSRSRRVPLLLLLLLVIAAAALATQLGGTVEGRFATQAEVGGNRFSAATDFEVPEGAP